jgi:hypothetical protein
MGVLEHGGDVVLITEVKSPRDSAGVKRVRKRKILFLAVQFLMSQHDWSRAWWLSIHQLRMRAMAT